MREIEFRGKRLDNGEWVYGDLKTHGTYGVECYSIFPARRSIAQVGYGVYPETVGQYTGLKDKNGTEIHEGDIIKTPYYVFGTIDGYENHVVVFKNSCFGIERERDFFYLPQLRCVTKHEYVSNVGEVATEWEHPFEVIGNIHDNPELLK